MADIHDMTRTSYKKEMPTQPVYHCVSMGRVRNVLICVDWYIMFMKELVLYMKKEMRTKLVYHCVSMGRVCDVLKCVNGSYRIRFVTSLTYRIKFVIYRMIFVTYGIRFVTCRLD